MLFHRLTTYSYKTLLIRWWWRWWWFFVLFCILLCFFHNFIQRRACPKTKPMSFMKILYIWLWLWNSAVWFRALMRWRVWVSRWSYTIIIMNDDDDDDDVLGTVAWNTRIYYIVILFHSTDVYTIWFVYSCMRRSHLYCTYMFSSHSVAIMSRLFGLIDSR
jgi:hypothetical protein